MQQYILFIQKSLKDIATGYLPHSSVEHWTAVLQQHLKLMEKCNCWGTHLELHEGHGIHVEYPYICCNGFPCTWRIQVASICLPDNTANSKNHPLVDTWLQHVHDISWLELCHTNASHYDSVEYIGPVPLFTTTFIILYQQSI